MGLVNTTGADGMGSFLCATLVELHMSMLVVVWHASGCSTAVEHMPVEQSS